MPSEQTKPQVELRRHLGRPTVFIDGEPHPLPGYNFHRDHVPLFSQHKMGVYLIEPMPAPGDYYCRMFWVGDEVSSAPLAPSEPGLLDLDQQAEYALAHDPNAYLIVRFGTRDPHSWRELHPADYFITEEGETLDTPSFASDLFWEMAARFSAALVKYVEGRDWAHRVLGYANFHYEEGVHPPVAQGWLFDHNPFMLHKWRRFLEGKYDTEETLQKAHGNADLSFANIAIPTDRLRSAMADFTQIAYWQAGADNQDLRDYLELNRDLWHQRFRQLAGAMAGAADRKVLFLHDALKQTMLGWNLLGFFAYESLGRHNSWSPGYPEFMAGSGNIGVAALFDAPGCDGLITPHDYQARGSGGVYEPEGIVDSAILRGKYFCGEMDQRIGGDIGAARDLRELSAIVWRNFATSFTRGFNSYWMHGFTVHNWFEEEPAQQLVRRHIEAIKESIHWPHQTMPGIAMILDDAGVLETSGNGNFLNEAIMWEQKMGLARCGVPHRIYLFEDLELENFPAHRVFYFPNLFHADEERMELLRQKVFRAGNVVVWGPGSGISDGEKIGPESAARLTGFDFEMLPANAARRILLSNFAHPLTHDLDADTTIGGPLPYGPILLPTDGLELGLAWTKGGQNQIGMSLKEFGRGARGVYRGERELGPGDYAALFMAAVPLPANLWRNIARFAGAHVYCESNDIVLANGSMVALHSLKGGVKKLALQKSAKVRDVVANTDYARNATAITFDLQPPETRVFLLES